MAIAERGWFGGGSTTMSTTVMTAITSTEATPKRWMPSGLTPQFCIMLSEVRYLMQDNMGRICLKQYHFLEMLFLKCALKSHKVHNHTNTCKQQKLLHGLWKKCGKYPTTKETWSNDDASHKFSAVKFPPGKGNDGTYLHAIDRAM